MPKKYKATNKNSLVQKAIEYAGGITSVATKLGLSTQTVAAWVKNDRITMGKVLQVCHLANDGVDFLLGQNANHDHTPAPTYIQPLDLLAYIENKAKPWYYKRKDKLNVLDALVKHVRGETTLGQTYIDTGVAPRTLKQIMTLWGDRLELLRDTLVSDLTNDVKAARLGVNERQVRRLMQTYLPERAKEDKPYLVARKRAKAKWGKYKSRAVRVIRGDMSAAEAATDAGISVRQMHRWLGKVLVDQFDIGLQEIRPLPKVFREALAFEAENDTVEVAIHLISYWKERELKPGKRTKAPDSWVKAPIKRCILAILDVELDLRALCEVRGTDRGRLVPLLTKQLTAYGVSYEQVETWPIPHQAALAEIINSEISPPNIGRPKRC